MTSRASEMRGAGVALVAFAIYSTHDVLVKWLGVSFSPVQIIFFSTLFGFPLVMLMLIRQRSDGNLRPRHPWLVVLRTALSVMTSASAFYAFSVLPLAQTYAIIFAAPLLITILAIPVLGEQVGWRRMLAVMVGLSGVIVVLQPTSAAFTLGHVAALLAAIGSAGAAVIVRKIGSEERSAVLVLYPMMANFLVMGALLPFVYQPVAIEQLGGFALIAVMSLIGAVFVIQAYRRAPAAVVAPMQYSQILWAIGYGALLFDETLSRSTAIGASIIIASGVYVVFREGSGASRNTPVLETRSRHVYGIMPRVSSVKRLMGRD